MLIVVAIVAVIILFLLLLLLIPGGMIVIVGGQEIGVIERKYFGRPLPEGRVVALQGEVGIRAQVLQPGLHVLFPFLYTVAKDDMLVIQEEEVGLVEAIDGLPLEPGRIFSRHVTGHDTFQDGEGFLKGGGQKGPQIDILPPGKYRINTYLFHVRPAPVVTIAQGQVGVVSARDGDPIPPGRLLAHRVPGHQAFQDGEAFVANGGQLGPQIDVILPGRYRINTDLFSIEVRNATIVAANQVGLVTAKDGSPLPTGELVAHIVAGHNDFQDGSGFLASNGQRGPQFDLLKPGTYYINPYMFDVKLDEVAIVQRGEVAVLVSNVGKEPEEQRQEDRLAGKERYVVPAGYRGIQAEVAGPGVYYLNRWAYIAYIIPTTNLTIDWAEEGMVPTDDEPATGPRRVQLFNPLAVISRDGFEMRVSVKVVIRVRPEQAPLMVAKIGSIENLIDHVVHPMIDSSFRNQASSSEAMNFMQDRADEQAKAEARARVELEKYHVECVSVLISQIILPQDLMEIHTRRVIAFQQQAMLIEQQKAEQERIATENTRAKADQQVAPGDRADRRAGSGADEEEDRHRGGRPRPRRRARRRRGRLEDPRRRYRDRRGLRQAGGGRRPDQPRRHRGDEVHRRSRPQNHAGHHGGGGGGQDGNANVFTAFIAQLLAGGRVNGAATERPVPPANPPASQPPQP